MNFKIGDKVRKVDGTPFEEDNLVGTISEIDFCGDIWIKETAMWYFAYELIKADMNVKELMEQLETTKKQIEMLEKQLEEAKNKEDKRLYYSENEQMKDKYYFINNTDVLSGDNAILLEGRLEHASAFRTREGAERVMRQQELMRKLQRFSEENGGLDIDWNNKNQPKYFIGFHNKIEYYHTWDKRYIGQVFFESEKACEQAIEKFKEELLEYFNN